MDISGQGSVVQQRNYKKIVAVLVGVIVIAGIVLVALFALITKNNNSNDNQDILSKCELAGGSWIESTQECEYVDKNFCDTNNGKFNECASACRNNPEAEACTFQCVSVCEFKKINQIDEIEQAQEANIIVQSGNQEKKYTEIVYENESAFELMNRLKANSDFTFEFTTYEFGVSIDSINGVSADTSKEFWQFMVNGQSSSVGVSDYIVRSGDILKFEITQF